MGLLTAGTSLGPYEIVAVIGVGGMGEVYQARDTRLNRIVAIKISQARFSERFALEAQSVAALNHPNICQLYDVGPDYLVMEYVEGSPIAAVDGVRKLLDLAVQIAEGLAAAHAVGLVHRDLKPDNILVTREGRVKILDFGLAKLAGAASDDATPTMALTDPGMTVGTVAYMSPEQARGNTNLNIQSDQFSFGLVLYELAAGHRAFRRGSAPEIMTAIIREDAAPLSAATPAPLRWVIERLLAKEPAERYDSTRDLYRELRQIRERLSESTSASASQSAITSPAEAHHRSIQWMLPAAVASLVLGAAIGWFASPRQPERLAAYKFTPLSRDEATERYPAWSPDGRSIAYSASIHGLAQVFTRALGTSEAAQLTRSARAALRPFWSKDGSTIYYHSDDDLWAVSASGGTPERVWERVDDAVIHPDGKIFAFGRERKLWVGSRDGEAHEFGQAPFSFSGGGSLVGFSRDGAKLAVIQAGVLWILSYPSGSARKLTVDVVAEASWMPDSRRIVVRTSVDNRLSIIDTTAGTSRVILRSRDAILNPSVSPDGKRIAYVAGTVEWDLMEVGLRDGRVRTMLAGGGTSWYPDWAPSGTHYLFATNRSGSWAIEDRSTEGFTRRIAEIQDDVTRLTEVREPSWAPDGARFVFVQSSPGGGRLMLSNASGGRVAPVDPDVAEASGNPAWSPDGAWIAYTRTQRAARTRQIVKTMPGSTGPARILWTSAAGDPGRARSPVAWSPAGDWILTWGRKGAFLLSPDGGTERQLTDRLPETMGFSKDGHQVLAISRNTSGQGAEWQLSAIDVATGVETLLAAVDLPITTENIAGYSLHPDGTRFLTSIAKWPFDIWMLEGFDGP